MNAPPDRDTVGPWEHKLTGFSPAGGCACKMSQAALGDLLAQVQLPSGVVSEDAGNLLIGLDPPDDAAVYAIDEERALVVTTDFQTPVLDDPFEWGRAAATNALSDVYAMGGRPVMALNLLGWPQDLSAVMLRAVLTGGRQAVGDAGALLVGGHSIVDPVPKFGLAVVGEVPRDRVGTKGGGRAGDVLVLTKPLGVGVVATGIKRSEAPDELVAAATDSMTRLNAHAAVVARSHGVRGGTDVTGYGLLGHLHEMAVAGSVAARIDMDAVPVLGRGGHDVLALIEAGIVPDGTRRTLDHALASGWFDPADLSEAQQVLLSDAQTSGGLLLSVHPTQVGSLLAELHTGGDTGARAVGDLVEAQRDLRPGTVSMRWSR